jgi:hypothetical protein
MELKKFWIALFTVLALGAFTAGSASAAAVTEDVFWTLEGAELTGSETVSSTGSNEFAFSLGETPVVLKSTGLECLECSISNPGGKATGTGKLKFTGVTVTTPAACAVSGGAVTTFQLTVDPDWMIGSTNYILFKPVSGTTFATVALVKGTGSCPLAGEWIVAGEVFIKSRNATDVLAVEQTVDSSGAINKEASGKATPLTFGSKEAVLNGTGTFKLSGKNAGQKFATTKKP